VKAYSEDLRERIIRAWQDGSTQKRLAETFSISVSSVKRYLARYEATGSVAATTQRRQEPRIRDEHKALLSAQVEAMNDGTLADHVAQWEQSTGVRVSVQAMSRAFKRFGLPRKKRHLRRANERK
jgi:transposase